MEIIYGSPSKEGFDLDILAFGPHPDDVELSCGGILLKHRALGYRIGIVDLTRGELGSRGNADIRRREAVEAAKLLQLTLRINLHWPDGKFEAHERTLHEIIRLVRLCQPSVVLLPSPSDRHPDHGRAQQLLQRGLFLSGLIKWKTYWKEQAQDPWRPHKVYSYIQDYYHQPDVVVDITPHFEHKRQIIACYASQFYTPQQSDDGPTTPISTLDFWHYIEAKDRFFGRMIGVRYGEGLVAITPRAIALEDIVSLRAAP